MLLEAISFREEKKLTEKPKLQTQNETLGDDKLKSDDTPAEYDVPRNRVGP